MLAAILSGVLAQAASGASSTPRLPTGAADLATFSAAEKKAALDYEWQQFQMALRAGTTQLHVASSGGTGLSGVASITTASVTYSCQVQWYNILQGSWTRGGGWTDSSASMSTIYGSDVSPKIGRFYRDGSVIDYWYSYQHNVSHAESWTAYNFKWWFEHPNYFVSGYHGAQQYAGGSWQLGPDRYCSASASP